MRLTRYTDYAMRTLLFIAARPERLCSIAEVADAYRISKNNLMKVVNDLASAGYLETVRGRTEVSGLRAPPARSMSARSFGIRKKISTWPIAPTA